jgi:hypothetical protein
MKSNESCLDQRAVKMGRAEIWGGGQRSLTPSGLAALLTILAAAVGCSKAGPEFVRAGGLVTLDSKPLAEAGVMFTPIHGGPVASATTDGEGRFELHTLDHAGALVGAHAVSVTKGRTDVKQVANSPMPLLRYIPELPEKYTRRETSQLTATVNSDASFNDFTLALTSK